MASSLVAQDVVSIKRRKGAGRKPRYSVAVKASKPKSAYLVLSPNEVNLVGRKSDLYVFTRVDLPDDHLLSVSRNQMTRLLKSERHFSTYENKIPKFRKIRCEVAGFAWRRGLRKGKKIPGQTFSGIRYLKQSGELRRSMADWRRAFRTARNA